MGQNDSNVIEFKGKWKDSPTEIQQQKDPNQVVDITEKRKEVIQEDRRQVKRTLLTEFIAVHAVVPGFGLLKVTLTDINEKGLAFEMDYKYGQFHVGDEIEFRIYLNHKTYFKLSARVAHVTIFPEDEVYRHGCPFIHDSINNTALFHFIKFLENVTASLRRDNGDIMISNINS